MQVPNESYLMAGQNQGQIQYADEGFEYAYVAHNPNVVTNQNHSTGNTYPNEAAASVPVSEWDMQQDRVQYPDYTWYYPNNEDGTW